MFPGVLETSLQFIFVTSLPNKCYSYHLWLLVITKSGKKERKVVSFSFFFFFLNWYSLHARLNSHYEAWSYKKRKHKKVKAYRKSIKKEPTVKRYLLILDLKPQDHRSKESIL